MMPGGHLATSIALGGVAYASTGSIEVATGCFVGGFLIDVDHYLDYLFFEKQWRRPSPLSFLRYYFSFCPKKLVLPLHSAEFMAILLSFILRHPWPLLVGYWVGALMHLIFDVLVNGDVGLERPVLFYFFSYRARYRFAAEHFIRADVTAQATRRPIRDFFRWKPVEELASNEAKLQTSSS
ncbi:MAG TPA: hypothetical protein VKY31_13900 [Terriglobia bacterium]|nr:hypothetical protein [Terriglobia bacterium]